LAGATPLPAHPLLEQLIRPDALHDFGDEVVCAFLRHLIVVHALRVDRWRCEPGQFAPIHAA